jgi:Ribosomal protein S11
MAKNTKTSKKKVVRIDASGKAFIYASFNNVIVSLTNNDGQVISWSSAGKMDTEVPRRTLRMQPKWLPKIVPRLLTTSVCARLRSM